jgi:hypothetical protein
MVTSTVEVGADPVLQFPPVLQLELTAPVQVDWAPNPGVSRRMGRRTADRRRDRRDMVLPF